MDDHTFGVYPRKAKHVLGEAMHPELVGELREGELRRASDSYSQQLK